MTRLTQTLGLLALWLAVSQTTCAADTPPPMSELATAPTTAAATQSGFDIRIDAPKDVEQMLSRHLELQRYRDQTDLSEGELDRLQTQAQQDARQLLGTLGYFSPTVLVRRESAAPPATGQVIHIQVTPGALTRVDQVQLTFTGAIATQADAASQRLEIQTSWSLRAGQPFTQAAWDSAKQLALRQLTADNYPDGRIVEALADIDPDHHLAHLRLTLDSGAAYRTGSLAIEGLQRFDAELVHQLARLTPGTPYRQQDLVAAQQRLSDSGYFDAAFVAIDTTTPPEHATVQVKLREAKLQKLVLGVGASTDSGPRLSLEHTHHKVPGLGWRAVSKAQLERNNSALGTELTAPPNADNWRWVASALLQNQLLGSLNVVSQQLRGGRKQSSERIDRNIYIQYDRATSASSASTLSTDMAQSLSANYAFAVRYYDDLPFPSSGWGWGAELGGGTTLGTQPQAYTRWLTRWQGFLGLGTQGQTAASASRLSMRATLAGIVAQDGINLPSTQLFLAGGDNSVRGYALNDIGITLADGRITAGRYLASGSAEWQRPVRIDGRLTDWESTLFVDAGAVANQPAALKAKIGVGAGARWKSPVGPLQIDLAYGVDVRRFRLHMNLGFTF
ncbi:BamA/TamA family outer membrane protein [Rhodoferax sp.]|uniref:autotransporter assembly complex protein TamA n=1 Tax=Rhodoferax sp. TaxID=50421 RepID=UPI00261E0850|nr:BamA/TamA family outer membrane protein [Rhodoferax sp.]MDD2809913.1 BamA/TamA family outer membrane protein [Rhodoferax sp.]MDD4944781.1 BamA/TamA family outer membrane protein [Rhodoferax sp.]